jgi:hypothetical protein
MSFTVYAELAPSRRRYAPEVPVSDGIAAARRAGRTLIEHRDRTLEAITIDQPLVASTTVRGIPVRNHSANELTYIRRVLDRLPLGMLGRMSDFDGIVCVDWTGSDWLDDTRPNASTLLAGGANIDRTIVRDGITESGRRIELTHSSMVELRGGRYERRGVFTLWHELGHAAYRNRLTPRTVERTDYGTSIHVGVDEQPAYAFMWYFLNPAQLTTADRAAFDAIVGRFAEGEPDPGDAARPRLEQLFPESPGGDFSVTRRGWRRPGPMCFDEDAPAELP